MTRDVVERLARVERENADLRARIDRWERAHLVSPAYQELTLEQAYAAGVVRFRPDTLRKWWRSVERRAALSLDTLLVRTGRHLFTTRARVEEWQRARAASSALMNDEMTRFLSGEEVIHELEVNGQPSATKGNRAVGAPRRVNRHLATGVMGAPRRRGAYSEQA